MSPLVEGEDSHAHPVIAFGSSDAMEPHLDRTYSMFGHSLGALVAFDDEDVLGFALPYVRADFELYESYLYSPETPVDCPIAAFRGSRDRSIGMSEIASWAVQTVRSFVLETVEGDHFFPRDPEFVRRLAP